MRIYAFNLRQLHEQEGVALFERCLLATPIELRNEWHSTLVANHGSFPLRSLKSLLFFVCEMSLGHFSPGHADFVGAFRLPRRDKYALVRTGDVFLGADEEAAIVDRLDDANLLVQASPKRLSSDDLRAACVLCIAYQYAMRPTQIAKVRLPDVRIYPGADNDVPAVHITFFRAKQRSSGKRLPMVRKVKREWSYMFAEFHRRRVTTPMDLLDSRALPDSLFGMTPNSISKLVTKTTENFTTIPRPANHLRHSAAQRLVDAGASRQELAEFMGHSYADTGLVYFDASPAQADRVNKALALSPIYSNIAEVARTRTIDKHELLRLYPEHQIAGVPHGIPIAGIGGCDLGQSLCSKNPVLACYTCRRFMAVTDVGTHCEVLESLRPVVRFFYGESRGETASPAYMQLRQTLESIQAVISDLEESTDRE